MHIARSCPLLRKLARCIYPLALVASLTRLCHCPLSRCLRRARRACGTFGHRVHSGWKKRQGCAFSAAIRTAIKEMAVSWEAAFDCVGNALHRLVIAVASEIVGSSHGRFDLQMSSVLKHRNIRNIKLGKRSQFSLLLIWISGSVAEVSIPAGLFDSAMAISDSMQPTAHLEFVKFLTWARFPIFFILPEKNAT